ncbi:serine/threonine protein kinase [bacterium]|nr:serine/threonine protein kinase [bacterium]
MGSHAGSVTAYFFKHNFCQCSSGAAERQAASKKTGELCPSCGKSKGVGSRLGSLTSFLFQDLMCHCAAGSGSRARGRGKPSAALHRTQTGVRAAQRRQFTESLKNKQHGSSVVAANTNLVAGDVVGGVFAVLSLIGEGGMGSVYLVEHQSLRKQFALKIMRSESVNNESWQRFKSEAQTIASFNHSTFVKVYDLGVHENALPYYSMDYLNGRSLEEVLIDDGPLAEVDAIDIYLELLDGLAYAHRNGIVHRDLKPANIMLCSIDGARVVKILDFGISKLTDSTAGKSQQLTVAGDVFGSPFYMSPEQCAGERIDARSDIYSLGCSLFETLTSYVPFDGANSFETMLMHQEDEPPELEDMPGNAQFSPAINLVIAKCLAKLPQDRYQSAKELALDLLRVKEGRDLLTYSQNYPKRAANAGSASVAEESSEINSAGVLSRGPLRMVLLGSLLLTVALAGICALSFGGKIGLGEVLPLGFVLSAPSTEREQDSAQDQDPPLASKAPSFKITDLPSTSSALHSKIEILGDSIVENADKEIAETERQFGKNHPKVANRMTHFASVYREQENYVKAEPLYRRLEKIYRQNLGADHDFRIDSLNNLGLCCEHQSRFAEAAEYYNEVVSLLEKRKGDHSKAIARELNTLATMYRLQRNYDFAEELYKRSIKLDPNSRSNSSYRSSRLNYAFLLRATNREKEALKLEQEDARVQPGGLRSRAQTINKFDEFMAE